MVLTALGSALGRLERVDFSLRGCLRLQMGCEIAAPPGPFIGGIRIAGAIFLAVKFADALTASALLNTRANYETFYANAFRRVYRIFQWTHLTSRNIEISCEFIDGKQLTK